MENATKKKKHKLRIGRVVILIVVLISLICGIVWFINSQVKDTEGPVISFKSNDTIQVDTLDGIIKQEDIFTVSDASTFTIDSVTPSMKQLKNGKQEVCVVATDEYENTTKKCATITIEIIDQKLASQNAFDSVEELVTSFVKEYRLSKNTLGFFYYSPQDSETYVYNGDHVFIAASTIKVPLNMIYYDKIANGEIDPSVSYKLIENDEEEGGGDTNKDYEVTEAIPLLYLQEQCIVNSDNTATNVLVRNLGGFSVFRSLLKQYTDAPLPANFLSENVVTPNIMLDYLTKLYVNQDRYAPLIRNMKNAAYGEYLQGSSDVYEIAQKYGLYDESLHAIGIVYTSQPYVVGIFTENVNDAESVIQELNKQLIAYQLQK